MSLYSISKCSLGLRQGSAAIGRCQSHCSGWIGVSGTQEEETAVRMALKQRDYLRVLMLVVCTVLASQGAMHTHLLTTFHPVDSPR